MSDVEIGLLSVVLPAHNEAPVIEASLARLSTFLREQGILHELILVADGCTDRTVELAEALQLPELIVEEQWPNGGKGSALRHGIMLARGEFVLLMDADLDIHPNSIGTFLQILKTSNFDVVVGSKTHNESVVDYPKTRRTLSLVFRLLTRWLFDLPISDTQTGLKAFRREALRHALPLAESDGFAFDLELLVAVNDLGYSICEGPIQLDYKFDSRVGIKNSVEALSAVYKLSRLRRRR
jgi:glycosyltransferase involved in cell wall biosynthesis